jgi:5-methyltetrahydrofolate--homocysteine methyltransferase
MEAIITQIYSDILHGRQNEEFRNVKSALYQDTQPQSILNDGMLSAMQEVGRLYEIGAYDEPEMLVASRAMQSGMNLLKPYLTDAEAYHTGKVAIGTVAGDYHDRVDILAMSALISTTMKNMGPVVELLEISSVRSQVRVLVGGAPVKSEFAQQIGADRYVADASRAVTMAKYLLSQ